MSNSSLCVCKNVTYTLYMKVLYVMCIWDIYAGVYRMYVLCQCGKICDMCTVHECHKCHVYMGYMYMCIWDIYTRVYGMYEICQCDEICDVCTVNLCHTCHVYMGYIYTCIWDICTMSYMCKNITFASLLYICMQ